MHAPARGEKKAEETITSQADAKQIEATGMATTVFLSPAKLAPQGRRLAGTKTPGARVRFPPARAQPQEQQVKEAEAADVPPPAQGVEEPEKARKGDAQSLPRQPLAESKNMSREYGGQWLSSATRHVRIYAAYIDPETNAFDQTQMDKLTLMLDPQDEFAWTDEACQMVFNEFQDLVDHYEVKYPLLIALSLQRVSIADRFEFHSITMLEQTCMAIKITLLNTVRI